MCKKKHKNKTKFEDLHIELTSTGRKYLKNARYAPKTGRSATKNNEVVFPYHPLKNDAI